MPGPIDNIAAKPLAPAQTDPISKSGDAGKFEHLRQAAGVEKTNPTDLPPMKEVNPTELKRMEHELRQKLEKSNTSDPGALYNGDVKHMRKRIDQLKAKVEAVPAGKTPSGIQDRLSAIEAQFNATEKKLQTIPDSNNLRDLLSMQTEMYKMSQNVELLSKVVDSATSGIKTTMQMQI